MVKEYVQGLVDEGKLRVEKIGAGNWYWSFSSDEKMEREQQLARLQAEVEKARKSYADVEALLVAQSVQRDDETNRVGPDLDRQRQSLQERKLELEADLKGLKARVSVSGFSVKQKGAQQLQGELAEFKEQALLWTDNLYILEQYVRDLAGDREVVAAVLQDCYGTEYVDGCLRDLE
ncbi:GAJ protein [Penicillium chermesinum]|nr:GAJ protein [Penicillium chermesinum]